MLGTGDVCERVEVVDDVLEVADQGSFAVRATVAQVIVGLHHRPPPP
jgi:hypothetical protein